jgi:hypothetical protein
LLNIAFPKNPMNMTAPMARNAVTVPGSIGLHTTTV